MAEDNRNSREPRSGVAQFASGDSGTSKDVVTFRDEVTFNMTNFLITYSGAGTTEAQVELYDDAEGTTEANLSGMFFSAQVGAGDDIASTGVNYDDINDDVVAVVRNNDDDVDIVVGGVVITG